MPRWISALLAGPERPEAAEPAPPLIDQRGIPTHTCLVCGCGVFLVRAMFEDYELSGYFLDAECAACGSPLTVPCPVDRPTGPA
jgi:hypothetical protein